jgi:hypothetical protein
VSPAVASNSGQSTNRHRRRRPDKAACGGDADETSDGAVDDVFGGDLLVVDVADDAVGDGAGASSEVGDNGGVDGLEVECKSGTAVLKGGVCVSLESQIIRRTL